MWRSYWNAWEKTSDGFELWAKSVYHRVTESQRRKNKQERFLCVSVTLW
jgi:hypothetical protein